MKSKMQTHIHENNSESLFHLEENEQKFSDQCLMILNLLNQGVRLSVKLAIDQYGVASLPRRIADIKERNGITNIQDEWIKDGNGKRLYKEWFITRPAPPTKGEIVEKWEKQLHPPDLGEYKDLIKHLQDCHFYPDTVTKDGRITELQVNCPSLIRMDSIVQSLEKALVGSNVKISKEPNLGYIRITKNKKEIK